MRSLPCIQDFGHSNRKGKTFHFRGRFFPTFSCVGDSRNYNAASRMVVLLRSRQKTDFVQLPRRCRGRSAPAEPHPGAPAERFRASGLKTRCAVLTVDRLPGMESAGSDASLPTSSVVRRVLSRQVAFFATAGSAAVAPGPRCSRSRWVPHERGDWFCAQDATARSGSL